MEIGPDADRLDDGERHLDEPMYWAIIRHLRSEPPPADIEPWLFGAGMSDELQVNRLITDPNEGA